ncbi:MAG: InlB B-repeat-containing protein [Treponema sp.]|nr:InlB B-repeat-containing protein [Treponema sp.]
MSNSIKSAIAVILAAAVFIAGCSLFENSGAGRITFSIDGETADKIFLASQSRAAARTLTAEEMEGLYFEIDLKGDYTAKKTLPVMEGATAVFDDIPVGISLYAEGSAYRVTDGEKVILYTGRSEEITIQEGKNSLSLVMKKTEPAEPEPVEPEPTEYTITFVLDGGQWEEGYTAPASCTEGEKLAEPEEPSRASSETASYFFEGWYTSADGGETLSETPYDFDSPVTAELTLYAKWKEVPVTEISATITVEESGDISVTVEKDETNIDKGIIIYYFTADEGYESYTWKLDGEEVTATSSVQNTFQFETRGKAAGTYDISLIAKKVLVEATEDTPAQYEYYSYEAHITVE